MKLLGTSAIVALLALPLAAQAADMSRPYLKSQPYVPVYTWTGWHVGLNLGYGMGSAKLVDTASFSGVPAAIMTQSVNLGVKGMNYGGQIGYDWQVGSSFVVGAEADFQWSNQKGSATASSPIILTTLADSLKIKWFGTARARAGYLSSPSTLWYVTGGGVYSRTELQSAFSGLGTIGSGSFTSNKFGWTLGGGVESALTRSWSLKLEYLYMDLGKVAGSYGLTPPIGAVTTSAKLTDNVVRVGVNYRF